MVYQKYKAQLCFSLRSKLRFVLLRILIKRRILLMIDYRKKFGEENEKRVSKWLASTLIFFPLLIPSLALGLEWLPETYLWISAGLITAVFVIESLKTSTPSCLKSLAFLLIIATHLFLLIFRWMAVVQLIKSTANYVDKRINLLDLFAYPRNSLYLY